jgi:hypothetical protein
MRNDQDKDRLDRLFDAVRKAEPYESNREYGFETRVMAKIRMLRKREEPFPIWAWRLVPIFLSIVIFLGIWTYGSEVYQMPDLSAVARIGNEESMLVAYLTGE